MNAACYILRFIMHINIHSEKEIKNTPLFRLVHFSLPNSFGHRIPFKNILSITHLWERLLDGIPK